MSRSIKTWKVTQQKNNLYLIEFFVPCEIFLFVLSNGFLFWAKLFFVPDKKLPSFEIARKREKIKRMS